MITTDAQLINALANNADRLMIDKASMTNAVAGGFMSLWRATGVPTQGAIPGSTAVACDKNFAGAMPWVSQTLPTRNYISWFSLASSNNNTTIEIHDRLAMLGNLSMTLTTAQTVTLDPAALGVSQDRMGNTDFSDIQWWIELYADGGATASNATVGVTYADNTTGTLVAAVGGTLRAGRMVPLNVLNTSGKMIKRIDSVTLGTSTGTPGNFGFTATRMRTQMPLVTANTGQVLDWAQLGLPDVAEGACLVPIMLCSTTTTGTLRGTGKLAHG